LDDGLPVGPIAVGCGVRQDDPLASLLFNLCFESLLAAMRSCLRGIRFPWGIYHDSAFADDSGVGTHPDDGPAFQDTLARYSAASNACINFRKSRYVPLDPDAPTPSWVISMGLQVHDPRVPFRVLGYDLALCPEGIQENWDKLYRELTALANGLLQRNVTLQGRVLLTNMLLTSRLQYKLRLSMSSDTRLRSFQNLAWNTVWKGSKLRSSHLLGRCPRQAGGLGFLAVKTQAIALHAQWIAQHFSR